MHYLDANETNGENAILELHKNATGYIEQIQEAIAQKEVAVCPLTSYLRMNSLATFYFDSNTWTRQCGSTGSTYIYLFCLDTGCSLENLPEAMDNWDG